LPAPVDGIQPNVNLLLLDPNNLFPYPFDPIFEELTSIFDSIGVDIQSRRVSDSIAVVMPGELLVILTDRKSSGWLSKHRIKERIMGAVMNAEGSKQTIFIYVQNIARLLGSRWVKDQVVSSGKIADLGKALGRVIGHELIHAIAPDHAHTSSGLMQARLTRDNLVAGDLRLDEGSRTVFLSALAEKNENRIVAEVSGMRRRKPAPMEDCESID
jgi:hypothetical protein